MRMPKRSGTPTRGRRRVAPAVVLAVVCGLACERALAPGEIEFEQYDALPEYHTWWAETKECLGIEEADIRRIRFFEVTAPLSPGGGQFPCDEAGTMCPAFWEWPHDIYVAEGVIRSEWVIRHEMVHDLRQEGHGDDPRRPGRPDPCAFPGDRLPF